MPFSSPCTTNFSKFCKFTICKFTNIIYNTHALSSIFWKKFVILLIFLLKKEKPCLQHPSKDAETRKSAILLPINCCNIQKLKTSSKRGMPLFIRLIAFEHRNAHQILEN